MSWSKIRRSCGHVEELRDSSFGSISAEESKLCRECYISAKNAEAAASNSGLTPLTGSEKQVAWAESLRAKFVKAIAAFQGVEDRPGAVSKQQVLDVASEVLNTADAKWWIDNKGFSGETARFVPIMCSRFLATRGREWQD